jgi:hypothetical protein
MQKWSWNKTKIRTCDLDQKNHETWLRMAYWTQRYLGRNVRKMVVLALYRPTSTSNINSLKEYESYAKWSWNKTWIRTCVLNQKNHEPCYQGRTGHKGILDAVQGRRLFLRYIDQHQHPTSTVWKTTKAMQKWSWNKTWVRTCDLDQKNHEPWLRRAYWTQRYLGRNIRKFWSRSQVRTQVLFQLHFCIAFVPSNCWCWMLMLVYIVQSNHLSYIASKIPLCPTHPWEPSLVVVLVQAPGLT